MYFDERYVSFDQISLILTVHGLPDSRVNKNEMKKVGFLLVMLLGISCASVNKSGLLPEDELFVTRKFVGNFVECELNPPSYFGNPHVLTITTTLDSLYGKISAYSKKCDFLSGDRLYVKRVYQTTGVFGSWIYQIENEAPVKVTYQISEFQNGKKVLAQSWF
jgi:hypothetical protein